MERMPPIEDIGVIGVIIWVVLTTLNRIWDFITEKVWPWFTVQVGLRTEQQIQSAHNQEKKYRDDLQERHQRFLMFLERSQDLQMKFEATLAVMNDRIRSTDEALLRLSESIDRFGYRVDSIEKRIITIEQDQYVIRDAMLEAILDKKKQHGDPS